LSKHVFFQRSSLWIMFFIFLTPTIRLGGMTGFRLEEIFVLMLLVVMIFFAKKGSFWEIAVPTRIIYFLCFSVLMIISITAGSLLILPTSILDLSKFIWLFKAVIIYLVFYNFIYCYNTGVVERRDFILKWFVRFGFLSSLICFQQYFNIWNLNQIYIPFIAPTQSYTLMPGYPAPRVVGMLGNPNVQGFVLALSLICYTFLSLKNNKSVSFYMFICLLIAMAMTLSRTSLIVYLAGVIILIMFYQKNKMFVLYKFLLFMFIISLIIGFYLLFKDNEMIYKLILFRFEKLEAGVNDPSLVARVHQWTLNFEYFKLSPIFGVGPLPRANLFGAADNEWLLFLRTYGIVGCIWLLLFLFYPLMVSKKNNLDNKNYKVFMLSILGATCLYMIPAAVITSPQLFPFILILLATHDHFVFSFNKMAN